MKFAVVIFPGSNCDRDMLDALQNDLQQDVIPLWHKDSDISMLTTEDCIVLPGGFSYGDYLRCGAIARFSPMMKSVIAFANMGGKVLGVCNGFQILCESGLLPGALLANANQQFICKNVFIKNTNNPSSQPLMIPIAHGEGRFYAADDVLKNLEDNKQIIYKYCDANGEVNETANPNGTTNNIAGIKNAAGNVFGMMPHPERACSNLLGNEDGRQVFKELLGFATKEAAFAL
jgi:phosphoribosylformylglycinamidine synthase subunit PurQ / glutaminase